MTDHITLTVQDAHTQVRVRCEQWEGNVHLTFLTYSTGAIPEADEDVSAPSFTPEGALALAGVLELLAKEAHR